MNVVSLLSVYPRARIVCSFALLSLSLATLAHAQTWDGGGGGDIDWSNAANWAGDTVPDFDTNPAITLTGASNYTSNADAAVTLTSLTFNPGGGNATLTGETLTFLGTTSSGTLINVGNASSAGNATIKNNIKLLGSGSIRATSRNLTLDGNLELSPGEVQFNANSNRSLSINGVISGTLSHVRFTGHVVGTGRVYLNNVNTYTATTTIWTGGVVIGVDALTTGGAFGVGTSSIYMGVANNSDNYTPSLLTAGAVTMARNIEVITNTNSSGTNKTTLGGTTAHTSVFSGTIQLGSVNQAGEDLTLTAVAGGRVNVTGNLLRASGATGTSDTVTKTGAGIVALSGGNNTWRGATTVSEGVFLVNGTLVGHADAEAVTVNSGATLGGAGGTIGRDVNLLSGSFMEVGDNAAGVAGLLTIEGNLDLAQGVTVRFDLGATQALSDRLVVGGNVTLGETVTFDLSALSGFGGDAVYTLLSTTGSIIGDTGNIVFTGYNFSDDYQLVVDATSISLVSLAIPEPGAAALLAGGCILVFAVGGRRRARCS